MFFILEKGSSDLNVQAKKKGYFKNLLILCGTQNGSSEALL